MGVFIVFSQRQCIGATIEAFAFLHSTSRFRLGQTMALSLEIPARLEIRKEQTQDNQGRPSNLLILLPISNKEGNLPCVKKKK
jgi:hypothetical protein